MRGEIPLRNRQRGDLSAPFRRRVAHRFGVSLPAEPGWLSIADLLVAAAARGVTIRCLVWRHEALSVLTRLVYLGEITVETELRLLAYAARPSRPRPRRS